MSPRTQTKPAAKPASRRILKPVAAAPATRSNQTPKQIELTGTTPLPVRITAEQQAQLARKRDRTGVPIQELVRRAIDHMLATVDLGTVPERR